MLNKGLLKQRRKCGIWLAAPPSYRLYDEPLDSCALRLYSPPYGKCIEAPAISLHASSCFASLQVQINQLAAMTSFHSRVKRRPGSPTPGWFTRGPDGYNSESLSVYEHGDFCPVLLGDVKGGQDLLQNGNTISFKIVAKLGYGSFSTVWLAKNVYVSPVCMLMQLVPLTS